MDKEKVNYCQEHLKYNCEAERKIDFEKLFEKTRSYSAFVERCRDMGITDEEADARWHDLNFKQ